MTKKDINDIISIICPNDEDFEKTCISPAYLKKELEVLALEQEPILDKIKAEIEDTLYVDSLIFGELIDFKNGKISADDVIEEFNRVTRLEVLKILDKYKAESEDKERVNG